jgi:hypothetical protein
MIVIEPEDVIKMESGLILQRLNKDSLWYAISNNRIIDYSQYRHDLIDRYK